MAARHLSIVYDGRQTRTYVDGDLLSLEPCPACELVAYWRAFIAWDAEDHDLWLGHPEGDEGEPEGYAELRARMPEAPNWASSVFDYTDAATVADLLLSLGCIAHPEVVGE